MDYFKKYGVKNMKDKFKKLLINILVLSILTLIASCCFVAQHESVHVEIYESYGIGAYWHYNLDYITSMTVAEAVPYNITEVYEKCDRLCYFEHDLNEIFSYNIDGVMAYVYFIILFFLIRDYINKREAE
jgi:hypothetical protein